MWSFSFRSTCRIHATIAIVPARYRLDSRLQGWKENVAARVYRKWPVREVIHPALPSYPFSFPTDRLWPASASLLSLESSRRIESRAGTDWGNGTWPRSRMWIKVIHSFLDSWLMKWELSMIIYNLFSSIAIHLASLISLLVAFSVTRSFI